MTPEAIHEGAVRFVEVVAAFGMMSGAVVLLYRIKKQSPTSEKVAPVGARTVQFMTVTMALPLILILGLEKVLDSSVIGTLLGGLFGYVLSHVGRFQQRRKSESDKKVPGST